MAPAKLCFCVESVSSIFFTISISFLITSSFDTTVCVENSSVCSDGTCTTGYTFSSIKYPSGCFCLFYIVCSYHIPATCCTICSIIIFCNCYCLYCHHYIVHLYKLYILLPLVLHLLVLYFLSHYLPLYITSCIFFATSVISPYLYGSFVLSSSSINCSNVVTLSVESPI